MKIEMTKIVSETSKSKETTFVDSIRKGILSKRCDRKLLELPFDTCELSPSAKIQAQANRIYSRTKKFTIDDYNSLSKLEKAVLREASSSSRKAADDSLRVGLKVKEKLDKYKGEDNYVFCCIGTSPSGVARVLEFSGVETKYLPISHLNWLESIHDWQKHSDKFGNYKEFLVEQGLSPERVSTSDKKFLFYDFVQQGMSLRVFEEMMINYFGLDLPNVSFNNVNYLCQSACAEKIDPPQYSIDYIENYMNVPNIAKYGGVPHLNIEDIDKIEDCKTFESLEAKKFNFCIIDTLAKKGLLKQNPLNKNSL